MKSRLIVACGGIIAPGLIASIIFLAAGRIDLPLVWIVFSIMAAFYIILAIVGDPGLLSERLKPGPGSQDRLTRSLGGLFLIAHWVIAGLDVGRYHWSPVPWSLQVAGVVGFAAALAVNFWAIQANRFYSSVVRVQTDRGQFAVDTGPYRFVRHPGYAASLVAMLSGGLALGSGLAMLPLLLFAVLSLRRTLLEDRMLHAELPGYADYATRVRSRLIPGVF